MPFLKKLSKKAKSRASQSSQSADKSFEEVSRLIVPILKPQKGPQKIITVNGEEHELPKASLPVCAPLDFDDLHFVFGIDKGVSYEWLQNKHIQNWTDEEQDQLMGRAFTNWFQNSDLGIEMISEDIGMIVGGQGMEASVFMVSSLWNAIYSQLGTEDIVFAIPSQDVFVFTRADKNESVNILREKAETTFNNQETQKPISPKLYRQVGNNTQIYLK